MTLSTEKTQQFPNGPSLRVFVVGDDIAILNSIWNLCFLQYHYEVSIFSTISLALNILKDGNDCVDIILIDAQMKDASSYSFVKYVKQQNKIPIMMISVDGSHNAMTKALENGAHAVWGKTFDENCIFEMQSLVIKMHLENKQDQKKRKRGRDIIKNAPIVTNGCVVENHHNHNHTQKKNFKWKTDLHEQFVKVVNQLGPAKVKPKEIMKLMNVPGLTQAIVSSHLQKFNKKSKRTPLSNETPEERNDNPDTITGEFLDLSASAPTQLGLKVAHPIPEQNLNVILDSVNKCDKNPKGNHQSALGALAEQDNNDNQDTNTSRVIDFLPQGPQPSREVVHPIPEQNHNATWDSADQCDNNSLETEQNCHKSDLNLWLDQPGSTFAELVEILKNQDTELQLGLKVAHPIPEQNHNATWDSAAHCANNSFETELNIPKILLAMNQYLNEDANCKTFEEEPQLSLGALADQDDSTHKSTRTEELLPPNQGN